MYFNSVMRYNATEVVYWWFWTKDSYYGHPTKNSTEVTALPTCRSHDFLNTSRYFSPYSMHDSARDVKRIETSRQNSATTPAIHQRDPSLALQDKLKLRNTWNRNLCLHLYLQCILIINESLPTTWTKGEQNSLN
jgi:hypothetical protein